MRTTIRLNDSLIQQLKAYSLETGESVTALITKAVRQLLFQKKIPPNKKRVKIPTFKGSGVLPGVDLDSTSNVLDLMEGF